MWPAFFQSQRFCWRPLLSLIWFLVSAGWRHVPLGTQVGSSPRPNEKRHSIISTKLLLYYSLLDFGFVRLSYRVIETEACNRYKSE
ncbi:hypothetical protein F5B21DRAFT_464115 [Xylaria acuta]|nr:hypothetical protein F5B21DRAFT_464115 [Xylaria acuta]